MPGDLIIVQVQSEYRTGEIVTYPADAPEQLPVVIDELLSNPGRAAQIAAAGRKKALQKHTWKRRGEQIAKWMDDGLNFTY